MSLRTDLDQIAEGRTLTCLTCGASEPASGDYFSTGWPKCCGYTMRLGDKP
jgi:hypothetical protein